MRRGGLSYIFVSGVLFGFLQVGFFVCLEIGLTAAYPSFLTVTVSWIAGIVAGLWLSERWAEAGIRWLTVAMASYLACWGLLAFVPYRLALLPLVAASIAVTGSYSGRFFVWARRLVPTARSLFFHENNGFIVGLLFASLLFIWTGRFSLWAFPIAIAVPLAVREWEWSGETEATGPHRARE